MNGRVAVLLNRNARRVSPRVLEALAEVAGEDLFVTRTLKEAREVARHVVAKRYPTVLLGGGDGTFVEWASTITREAEAEGAAPPRFALLPLGTGNALAKTLGLGATDPWELRRLLRRAREVPDTHSLRLLEVEGKLTPFAGFGLDAMVLEDHDAVERALKPLNFTVGAGTGYALSVLLRSIPRTFLAESPEIIATNIGAPAVAIDDTGRPSGEAIPSGSVIYRGRAAIASASTIPYVGLAMRLFPYIENGSERFQLRVADTGVLEILGNLPAIWRGTYRADSIRDFLCTSVLIEADPASPFQIGGDLVGRRERAVIELAERRIRVLS